MLKNKNTVVEMITKQVQSDFPDFDVRVTLNNFTAQNGKIKRVYVNINMVKYQGAKKKVEKGGIGYFDLVTKTFVREGRFYSAGISSYLGELCGKFEIEEDIEETQILEEKAKKEKEVRRKVEEIDRKIEELEDMEFPFIGFMQKSEEEIEADNKVLELQKQKQELLNSLK